VRQHHATLARVVVVHQPIAVTRAEDEPNRLRGHAAALQRWAEAGADLVMGGHIHLPYVMPAQSLARPLWVVQAGTAVSSRVRDGSPNSVNLLRWGTDTAPGCCRIEQWDYDADDRAFRLAEVSEVRPDRAWLRVRVGRIVFLLFRFFLSFDLESAASSEVRQDA